MPIKPKRKWEVNDWARIKLKRIINGATSIKLLEIRLVKVQQLEEELVLVFFEE